MRRAALLCVLGCYPSSNLTLPPDEGFVSRILLGSDRGRVFAHASKHDDELSFHAGDDLILEALLYRATLAELGLGEGPIPVLEMGRPPPTPDSVRRTTISGGEFSGWDSVSTSELSSIRIPHFDANACTGCLTREAGEPRCKLDCIIDDPRPPDPPQPPNLAPPAIPPACPAHQVAYAGESECHTFNPCLPDGWPDADVDAYVRFGSAGNGTRASPFDTVTEAIAAGARRIALSAGTHEFDGTLTVPVALYGACAEETIVISVLRMRDQLLLHDVTVMGGIETCSSADIRRVHLHGGPLLGERALITGVDLALHGSHVVLADSSASFERLFVASDLDSFTCWGTNATIDNALLTDLGGSTLVVGSTCSVDVRNAVLLPFDSGAVVEGGGLVLSNAFVEGTEGGILIKEGGTATITGVRSKGDEGLEVVGFTRISDSIIESIDQDGGAALTNFGRITGARVQLIGGERGITTVGGVELSDVIIDSGSLGVVVGVDGGVSLIRASIASRITCIDAIGPFSGDDLSLLECETGLSTANDASVHRVEAIGARIGAAVFSGLLRLEDAHFETSVAGIDVENGQAQVLSFLIENGPIGAEVSAVGELSLQRGRLSDLETGLVLPPGLRPEQVLDEVSLEGVERVVETR